MYDLCTRPEPPLEDHHHHQHQQPQQQQQQQQQSPPAEGEPEGRGDTTEPLTAPERFDGEKTTVEQGADSSQDADADNTTTKFSTASSVLGKRQHSLYEGVNGCEVSAYGKVGVMHGIKPFYLNNRLKSFFGTCTK